MLHLVLLARAWKRLLPRCLGLPGPDSWQGRTEPDRPGNRAGQLSEVQERDLLWPWLTRGAALLVSVVGILSKVTQPGEGDVAGFGQISNERGQQEGGAGGVP